MDLTIELAKGITIKKYLDWKDNNNKIEISEMIYQRFYERYIKPYSYSNHDYKKNYKNGFAMMASASLMIETFMSFKKGWNDTSKITGRNIFGEFFDSAPEFSILKDTRKDGHCDYLKDTIPARFYYDVRCGILHQGETRKGWTITRKENAKLFDKTTLRINAYLFLKNLEKVLKVYELELKKSDWNDEIWINTRNKLNMIIKNCSQESI